MAKIPYLTGPSFLDGKVTRRNIFLFRHPHPRRPMNSQSGREKGRDKSFQVRAKEPLGTDSHRAISKSSSGCRPLITHKNCFVLLCPIGEQFLLSSFRECVHDGYCFNHGLSGSCTGSPCSVIVPQYGSSKITVFAWGKNTIYQVFFQQGRVALGK